MRFGRDEPQFVAPARALRDTIPVSELIKTIKNQAEKRKFGNWYCVPYLKVSLFRVARRIRSSTGWTPIPGPWGTRIVPGPLSSMKGSIRSSL